jgi:phospholipid-binding lipoprotein MlaA
MQLHTLFLATITFTSMLGGCATLPPGKPDPSDRFERVNRSVFSFNRAIDHAVVRPMARAYVKITPAPVRSSISNFFTNLDYPITIVNDFLQGKLHDGFSDVGRFGVNSVIGIGGLFDPASHWGMEKHNEDFGLTLARWGLGSGPYLMLPILGPSTVRDAPGRVADRFVTPTSYLNNTGLEVGTFVAKGVTARAGVLDMDQVIDSAFDPYAFVRNAWLQRREYQIHNGKVPETMIPEDESDRKPPEEGDRKEPEGGERKSPEEATGQAAP